MVKCHNINKMFLENSEHGGRYVKQIATRIKRNHYW